MAEINALSLAKAKAERLQTALSALLPLIRYLDNAGPCCSGWQSDDLEKAIADSDSALAFAAQKEPVQ